MITINHPHIAVNARTNACFCPGKLSIRKTEQEIKSVCTIRNALVVERHLAWVWTYNHPRSRSVASEVVFSCPFVCVCVCLFVEPTRGLGSDEFGNGCIPMHYGARLAI